MKACICMIITVCLLLCGVCCPIFVRADDNASVHHYASALMEAESGTRLDGRDSDVPLPVGSLTKLMTVYLAAEAVESGVWTLDTVLSAPPSAEDTEGAVIWLESGEQMSLRDLLKAVIIGNANDAAVTLAVQRSGSISGFVGEMNAAAFSLGMRHSRFADCTGHSNENISTAHDIALLCRALLKTEWLTPMFTTWRELLRDGKTELVSENTLTRTYEGILGFKAGHGDASGYTLAVAAERNGMRMIAVVLGCDEKNERFAYGKNLLSHGFSDFYVTTPSFSTEFLRPVPVAHGTSQAVNVCTEELFSIAAPHGAALSSVCILPRYLEAPVYAGMPVGTVGIYCDDSLLYEVSLCAEEAVPRRTFGKTLAMLLENLFK